MHGSADIRASTCAGAGHKPVGHAQDAIDDSSVVKADQYRPEETFECAAAALGVSRCEDAEVHGAVAHRTAEDEGRSSAGRSWLSVTSLPVFLALPKRSS